MKPRQLVDRLAAFIFGDPSMREYERLSREAPRLMEIVASDVGTSPGALGAIVAAGRPDGRLDLRMMAAFGIRPETLSPGELGALRDVAVTCAQCTARSRCARELDAGTAVANAGLFCPNLLTLEALRPRAH